MGQEGPDKREKGALVFKNFNKLFVGKSYLQLIKFIQERWIT